MVPAGYPCLYTDLAVNLLRIKIMCVTRTRQVDANVTNLSLAPCQVEFKNFPKMAPPLHKPANCAYFVLSTFSNLLTVN